LKRLLCFITTRSVAKQHLPCICGKLENRSI
jgi:hypothetical protein